MTKVAANVAGFTVFLKSSPMLLVYEEKNKKTHF